ncbi:MAG: hypothetical protein CBC35_00075 [Planctomycetes bacterium TMED75]|nr:hypothetical protein [Planctomycetaceae bacterium]OUU96928.1 MAG: hypothetical protein CBC35_00075 [Planctomycetes bacterium TMED75]
MTIFGLLFIAAVGFAFAMALVRPWFCFVLVCCFPIIEGVIQSYIPFFASEGNRPLINYMVALLAGTTVVVRFFREPGSFRNAVNPILILVILLQLLSYLALSWTSDLTNGLSLTWSKAPYSLLYILVAPLLISTLPELGKTRVPFIFIATSALIMLMLSPNVRFEGERLVNAISSSESTGTLINGELGVMVIIFVALTTYAGTKKLVFPLAALAGFIGLGMGLYTGARGQVLAGILVIFILFPVARRIQSFGNFMATGVGLFIFLVIIVFAIQFFVTGDNADRWSYESLSTAGGRGEIVVQSISSWMSRPSAWLLGSGTGSFMTLDTEHIYPHNHVVELLIEVGIVGLGLYLTMLYLLARYSLLLYRTYRDDDFLRPIVALLLGICLFVFILSLKQGSVHAPGRPFLWFLLLGRLGAREVQDALSASAEVDDIDEEDSDLESDEELQHA